MKICGRSMTNGWCVLLPCRQRPSFPVSGMKRISRLTDFAADLRAPTPTAAAELATPITVDDLKYWINLQIELLGSIRDRFWNASASRLETLDFHLRQFSPVPPIADGQAASGRDESSARDVTSPQSGIVPSASAGLDQRLMALSPLEVLKRGYAVVNRSKEMENSSIPSKKVKMRG